MRIPFLALLVVCFAPAALCRADAARHFSFQPPPTWVEDHSAASDQIKSNRAPGGIWCLGVFHAPDQSLPVLLVLYQDKPQTLGQICSQLSSEFSAGGAWGQLRFDKTPIPSVDPDHNRVTIDATGVTALGDPTRVLAYYYPGSRGVVQLAFLSRADDFANHHDDFLTSADSMAFDPGYRYVPPSPLKSFLGLALALLIPLALILALIFFIKPRRPIQTAVMALLLVMAMAHSASAKIYENFEHHYIFSFSDAWQSQGKDAVEALSAPPAQADYCFRAGDQNFPTVVVWHTPGAARLSACAAQLAPALRAQALQLGLGQDTQATVEFDPPNHRLLIHAMFRKPGGQRIEAAGYVIPGADGVASVILFASPEQFPRLRPAIESLGEWFVFDDNYRYPFSSRDGLEGALGSAWVILLLVVAAAILAAAVAWMIVKQKSAVAARR